MKKITCVILVILLLFSGCTMGDNWERTKNVAEFLSPVTEDPQLRRDAQAMLDALIGEDLTAAYALVSHNGISLEEFQSVYVRMLPLLAEVDAYELTPSYIGKNVINGAATTTVRYMMTAGEQNFLLEVSRLEGQEGLRAFYIDRYEPVVTTGTLGNMDGANALQWILLAVGLLGSVFTLWMFVDCCCHKLKKKWLWLLLIALGYLVFTLIVTPQQFRINFNVGVFLNHTRLLRYSTGGFTLQIVVPVGAVIYLCMRRSLFAKYAKDREEKQEPETLPQPAAEEILPVPETEVLPEEENTQE